MIKGYTNIEQSEKLAEILSRDSADMVYAYSYSVNEYTTYPYPLQSSKHFDVYKDDIPCWSLSALLSVLPKLGAEEPIIQKIYYASNPTERYICQYSLTNMTGEYDNPVDACYEMVTILKEKNLI